MNDLRTPDPSSGFEPHAPEVAKDLDILARQSRVDVPSLGDTARAVAARETRKETMGMGSNHGRRPAWVFAAAATAIALALIFVPVSYDRTVGQELSFTVSGADLAGSDVDGLAQILTAQLGDAPIRVEVGNRAELIAHFAGKSRADVEAVAKALQSELTSKGLEASFEVTPIKETVSTNVYAYAAAQWQDIRVETAGRSDFEIENEIRSQLAAQGFMVDELSYQSGPDGARMRVEATSPDGHKLIAESEHMGAPGEVNVPTDEPVNIMMLDPSECKGKSDAEIEALVEQKLRERGIYDAEVTVKDGQVEITAHQTK
jgi:hypothetical protein